MWHRSIGSLDLASVRAFVPTVILLACWAAAGWAQLELSDTKVVAEPKYMQFPAGDLRDRTFTHVQYTEVDNPQVLFLPGEALNAAIYIKALDGEPGWFDFFNEFGWNCFALDLVGCGNAPPPAAEDIVYKTDRSVYGAYQMGMASKPTLWVAQGLSAAFTIKTRSTDPEVVPYAVLIDPIGPPGAQEYVDWTSEQARERKVSTDHLWQEWGVGPRPGKLYRDVEISKDEFEGILADYHDPKAPAYWAAALTGLNTPLRVDEPVDFDQWPVLILRSPNRSSDQIQREDQIAEWLSQRGALVERRDLAELDLPGLSALPMLGRNSRQVATLMHDWVKDRPDPYEHLR